MVQDRRLPARPFDLSGKTVDIWTVHVTAPDAVAARFRPFLTPGETARAARFRFEHLQRSFTVSRAVLRLLLAQYLHIAPDKVELSYGSKGKPYLAAHTELQFNVSHSEDLALFAFTFERGLGVDIEYIRPIKDMHDIANRFFCPEEASELMSLPAYLRERAFFSCWTRKEAYIKAVGEGLSVPLNSFRVTLRPGEPTRFIHLAHDTTAARAWALHNLDPDHQYAAALAYQDAPRSIRVITLSEPTELLT